MTRVLVVDDREDNLCYLRTLLEGNGFEVQGARHGAEALVIARKTPPDLIISDLLMPVMDGYTLLRHWKVDERLRAIPFIVYTATYTEAEDERLALGLGADAFILKPAEPEDFLARIREVQATVAASVPIMPANPVGNEKELLRVYSETLIRKLEQKSLQLEESNRALKRDIENRIKAEDALRLLGSAVLQSTESVLITEALLDLPGPRIVFVNPAFTRLTGYNPEEVIGRTPRILQGPRTDKALLKRLRETLERGEVFRGQTINYRKDGSEYEQEWQITPIRDTQRRITHFGAIQRDVTERNRIARALELNDIALREMTQQLESERARLLAAQQVAKVGSWETDLSSGAVLWSDETHRIHETDPETFQPTHEAFLQLVHPDDRKAVAQAFDASQTGHGPFSIEHRLCLSDGRIKFVEERWQIVADPAGVPLKAVGTCQDISERARAAEALRNSEERFRGLLQNVSSVAVQSYALDGTTQYWNRASEHLYGYTAAEAIGRNLLDLIIPQAMHDDVRAAIRRMGESGQALPTAELTLKRKDGQPVTVISSHAIVDVPGRALELFCIDVDVSERQRAEQALRTSEAEFRTLGETLPQIVWVARPDGWHTQFNQRWTDYTGLSAEDSVGDGWMIPLHPDDRPLAHARWQQAVASGEVYEIEYRLRGHDGSYRWMLGRALPLRDGDGSIAKWFGTFTDVHDLKEAELRIKRLNRVQSVLSHISSINARARDHDELFNEVCRIAVDTCGFRMAMACVVDEAEKRIVPVASAGKDAGLMNEVKALLASSERASRSMVARALRVRGACISNDSEHDPSILLGERYTALGVHSIAVFPMIVGEVAIGALALYSGERDYFQEEEIRLFAELSSDVAVAFEKIDKGTRLNFLVYYDTLTGLANRSLFLERVAQYMRAGAGGENSLALFLIDLERFKNINDSLGRASGDALLQQVARWLVENVGDVNLLARTGADQFAMVMPEEQHEGDVARLLERMIGGLASHPFELDNSTFRIAAKFGVALFPADAGDAETLFRLAEAALKKAKLTGERYLFYREEMTAAVAAKLALENQLRQALERGEFELYYQPKVEATTRALVGAEALIRWNHPHTGLVPPAQFIPILEETGLILEVGRWALKQAVADYLRWRQAGLEVVRIAVNVSPLQLRDRNFVAGIEQVLAVGDDAGSGLELEITESVIMEDVVHSIASLQAIRALGVSIAIDDFGTGFSSLSYLARLPADKLKIDRSFTTDMTRGPAGLALVSNIISLAHSLNLKVIAEGVETEEQSRLLSLLKCDEMQGYLFSLPVAADVFESTCLTLRGPRRNPSARVRPVR